MRISSSAGLLFSLVGFGVSGLLACGGEDTKETATSTTTSTTGTGGATSTTTSTMGTGGDTSTSTMGTGGATGQGGAMGQGGATGQGGAGGAGGGGGSGPAALKGFFYWGDFASNGLKELALFAVPEAMHIPTALPGVKQIDVFYEIAQSHDGKKLAMALSADGGKPKVFVGNADGTGEAIVVADFTGAGNATNLELTNLAWSPNDMSLAFRLDAATNGQHLVHVVPADGSQTTAKLVTPSPTATQEASPSLTWADNTHIAVVGDFAVDNSLNLFLTDTMAAVPTLTAVIDASMLNVSTKLVKPGVQTGADGKLYFLSSHATGKTYLYAADANGMNVGLVAAAASVKNGQVQAELTNFALSPDAMSVAFGANELQDGLVQLFTAPLAAQTATKITAFTMPPAMGESSGPSSSTTNAIVWRPDGMMLGVIADWKVAMADADNDYAAFVVPTTGNPAPVRVASATLPTASKNVGQLAFSGDSTYLAILGDLAVNNDTEFYSTVDFTTADQQPVAIRTKGVVAGGDIEGISVLR